MYDKIHYKLKKKCTNLEYKSYGKKNKDLPGFSTKKKKKERSPHWFPSKYWKIFQRSAGHSSVKASVGNHLSCSSESLILTA